MNSNSSLDKLKSRLTKLKKSKYKANFTIPAAWVEFTSSSQIIEINPFEYFLSVIEKIEELSKVTERKNNEKPCVYNLFPRFATAFDHIQDNKLVNKEGEFKETGTFLKCIALIPYFKRLGIDIIYTLPVTEIGEDGRKGDSGSPYAIKNPYKIDANLSEPLLEMTIEEEYSAFIEACHTVGIKVVTEFVFRTAAIDSDLSLEHPEWFYWIKANTKNREKGNESEARYGAPVFTKKELEKINKAVEAGDFDNLTPPHEQHRKMFVPTPQKIARVEGKIFGVTNKKDESRLPGAFADWPPNDNQPAWSDVTYLKLYDHPEFNYIAYNTIRMYDNRLIKAKNKVKTLWEYLIDIVPYYQNNFGIDGVMIDMGHALPKELLDKIIKKAKSINKDFIFWEENFALTKESIETGYDAVLGYACFDEDETYKIKNLISLFAQDEYNLPDFFATAETHNTKRAYSKFQNTLYNLLTYKLNKMLPTHTFIHNGFELCEELPVNTGLGFTEEEIADLTTDKLALFSTRKMNWQNENSIIDNIININDKVQSYNFISGKIEALEIHDNVISFARNIENGRLIFIATIEKGSIEVDLTSYAVKLLNIETNENINGKIVLNQFDSYILFQSN